MKRRVDNDGNYSGFISDVELAWKSASREINPSQLALQTRYALIQSSIRTLATNVPPVLYPSFVAHGLWTISEAIAFAVQIPNLRQRNQTLLAIAGIPGLLETDTNYVLSEALRANWTFISEWDYVRSLEELIPRLSPELLSQARQLVDNISAAELRQSALSALVPRLASPDREQTFEEALALAQAFRSPTERAEGLTNLAPMLSFGLLELTLNTIAECDNQLRYLRILGPHVPPELHTRAIGIAETLSDPYDKLRILVALASRQTLPPELRDAEIANAVRLLREITKLPDSVDALCAVARVQADLRQEAVERVLAHWRDTPEDPRVLGLLDLIPVLDPTLRARLLESLKDLSFDDDYWMTSIVSQLEPYLTSEQATRVIQLAPKLRSREARLKWMGALILHLPPESSKTWAQEAYKTATEMEDRLARERAIAAALTLNSESASHNQNYATRFPSPSAKRFLFQQLLNTIKYKLDQSTNWLTISDLVEASSALEDIQLDTLLDSIIQYAPNKHEGAPHIAYLVGGIARRLSGSYLLKVFDFVVSRVKGITEDSIYTPYICTLADVVSYSPVLLQSMVRAVFDAIHDPRVRTCILAVLAPHVERAWLLSRHKEDPFLVGNTSEVLRQPNEEGNGHALGIDLARKLEKGYLRSWVFLGLLPQTPSPHLHEVISESLMATKQRSWLGGPATYALLRIVPYMPLGELKQIVDVLDYGTNVQRDGRIVVFRALAHRLMALPMADANSGWSSVLHALANRTRSEFLEWLEIFVPVIRFWGGEKAVHSSAQAILEVADWWQS